MILANMCHFALIEARKLVLVGTSPSPLQKLVFTAEGLLDDLDERLLALDPLRDAAEFAFAASLHRALDELAVLRHEAIATQPPTDPLSAHNRLSPL